jgi:hypothetical protein
LDLVYLVPDADSPEYLAELVEIEAREYRTL